MYRAIKGIYQGPSPHWVGDGFHVQQYIPGRQGFGPEVSPFLMMDYHAPYDYPPSAVQRGVGPHPHRGFETVTLVYQGRLAHHDSFGNSGEIGPGDVQWMTAASGILHAEYHEKNWSQQGGTMHCVQLWVNLPAKDKMAHPRYQTLLAENMGRVVLDDAGGFLRVIAGEYQGVKGPALTWSPVGLFDASLKPQSRFLLDIPAEHTLSLLALSGELKLNGESVLAEHQMALFTHEPGNVLIEASRESQILILSGAPIQEPVASYGPFVMNTREELIQAVQDFEQGKFGVLNAPRA